MSTTTSPDLRKLYRANRAERPMLGASSCLRYARPTSTTG